MSLHLRSTLNAVRTTVDLVRARWQRADLAVFHDFMPAPYGGAHQFLRALCAEFERRGLRLSNNTIPPGTRACLYNSFNFDFRRLKRFARAGCRMVHRVDGPISVYRGRDDGVDRRISDINRELADATIFQSRYSLERHAQLGLPFKAPCVIHNAADPAIFNDAGREPFSRARKVRLIATSWSDNPNKGAAVYKWLEDRLDWNRFDFTFVGRSPVAFDRIRVVPPQPSDAVADLLRAHDIFITASLHESCSNALIEALSCGLPAIYADSGGNPELVGAAGFGFSAQEEIPQLLDRLADEYGARRDLIAAPRLSAVADAYLAVLGVPSGAAA
jgi:glycosyltransferase involved in cell wall biosynthesis